MAVKKRRVSAKRLTAAAMTRPISAVVKGKVTAAQRRKKMPEWSRVTPATQKVLDGLNNHRSASIFKRANAKKLATLAAPQRDLIQLPQKFTIRDLIRPEKLFCRIWCPWKRLRVRKNQKDLSVDEWERFIGAVTSLMQSGMHVPTYQEFVDIHVQAMTTQAGMQWGAHGDTNFLPWHRDYLFAIESRLRLFNPNVTIPYWDWTSEQSIPVQLSDPADMAEWGISRNATVSNLPTPTQLNNTMAQTTWDSFRTSLEGIHNTLHVRVGGQMVTASSPSDPLFWLHHAFVDKVWADWQKINTGSAAKPSNLSEQMQPAPLISRTVSQTMSTTKMGYLYV